MKVKDERDFIQMAGDPDASLKDIKEKLMPLFREFYISKAVSDVYNGLTLSIRFIKKSHPEFEKIKSECPADCGEALFDGWRVLKSLKNKITLFFKDDALMVLSHYDGACNL